MGNGKAAVPQSAIDAYEVAAAELAAAEAEWEALMARLDQDTELQDVLSAIDRATEHAPKLLDPLPHRRPTIRKGSPSCSGRR
ncbi:MAG: hypothetical protein R2695_15825 [Acidimicrobiales bacterium]